MKNQLIYKVFAIVVATLFACSCSIQKRHYMKGYYIASSLKKESLTKQDDRVNAFSFEKNNATRSALLIKPKRERLELTRSKPCPGDSCNDVIYFVSGIKARVKVMIDSADVVKYVICDKKNGKLYTSRKKDIQRIQIGPEPMYVEGEKQWPQPEKAPDLNGCSLAAFITSAISSLLLFASFLGAWLLFTAATLILTIIGLTQILSKRKKYRSKWLIIFPCIYILALIGLFIALILFFSL